MCLAAGLFAQPRRSSPPTRRCRAPEPRARRAAAQCDQSRCPTRGPCRRAPARPETRPRHPSLDPRSAPPRRRIWPRCDRRTCSIDRPFRARPRVAVTACYTRGMVQAPGSPATQAVDVTQLLEADREHLIHPLYHPADHAKPLVVVRGEGAEIIDANGKRYFDALSGLWNVHVGHGRTELAQVAAEQMSTLAFNNNYVGFANVPSARLAEKLIEHRLSQPERGLLHDQRRRVERVRLQDRALLLEAAGQAGQGQDHLAPLGLPRRDDGRGQRHRPARLPQHVRAAGAELHPDGRPVPLPLRARGGRHRARAPIRPSTTTRRRSKRRLLAGGPRHGRRHPRPSRSRARAG